MSDVKRFSPEFYLFISCKWRIDSDTEVICSSREYYSHNEDMVAGLNMLVGATVEKVGMIRPACDLVIRFSNSLVLTVFCNDDEDSSENYVFFTPAVTFGVGPKNKLDEEARPWPSKN